MKASTTLKNIFVIIICYLYVLLFVYAAASKLFDFQNFQVQLGQSPLLGAFAIPVSWMVPVSELLLSLFLLIPATRLIALYGSYFLMVMFTAYIYIILNYSSFVPCSCGGILEKLNWTEHLIFNLVFVLLAAVAIVLSESIQKLLTGQFRRHGLLVALAFAGTGSMVILFTISEDIVHHHNTLTRRFPHTPVYQSKEVDLHVNSYYLSGVNENRIYLGNTTAPLLMTAFDSTLRIAEKKMIDLNVKDLPFKAPRVVVNTPDFFVVDGTVPCIYKGATANWNAKLIKRGGEYFATVEAVSPSLLSMRTHSSSSGEGILGVINTAKDKTILNPEILQKQLDGVFDIDGQLLYSNGLDRIVYVYAYRNQFTVIKPDLTIDYRGNTIDTNTIAKLNIVKVESRQERKFSKPPLLVNKSSATHNNLLFVNSGIPGRFEDDRIWKGASIIDVYDLSKNSYLLSFLVYDIDGKKLRDFRVYEDTLYALIGNKLFSCRLNETITKQYTTTTLKQAENLLAK